MNSEQDMSAELSRDQNQSGAGARLKQAREAQGLSLGEIATRTRIPIRQLEVIEAGAFSALPSRTYAIGFARTYARALGLSEGDITSAVRAELGDVPEPRTTEARTLEPGDPAKLPSKGLAWAGAIAALLLAAGLFAWFGNYFGAGQGAAALVDPEAPSVTQQSEPVAAAPSPKAPAVVTFTATEDGVWVRLFESGGEGLLQKTLAKGESFTVPATARDPRLNTGRPDALAIMIDGKPVARLAERPVVLGSEPVSAGVLLARAAQSGANVQSSAGVSPATAAATTPPAAAPASVAPVRATRRSFAAPPASGGDNDPAPVPTPLVPVPLPAPAAPEPVAADTVPAVVPTSARPTGDQ